MESIAFYKELRDTAAAARNFGAKEPKRKNIAESATKGAAIGAAIAAGGNVIIPRVRIKRKLPVKKYFGPGKAGFRGALLGGTIGAGAHFVSSRKKRAQN